MNPNRKIIAAVLLGALCFLIWPGKSATQVKVAIDEPQKHEAWLGDRLSEAESIKVGMTKAELLKVFTLDGGLMGFTTQRFVLRSCQLIKVDVKFDFGIAPKGAPPILTSDNRIKITDISKPYLELPFAD